MGMATNTDMPPACFTFFVPPNDGSDEDNQQLLSRVKRTGKFDRSGTLFVTNETNDMFRRGGQFPVFHLEESQSALRQILGTRPDQTPFLAKNFITPSTLTRQGLYRQVHRFEFEEADPNVADTACILMAFKSMQTEPDRELVQHWKSWTGARGLMVDFGSDVAAQSASFYVREGPADLDVFMYIVIINVFTTGDSWCMIRHLVQRFRVERQFGYISVYKGTSQPSATGRR
ncbi:uncharacterized protein LOC119106765 [Pollicipes pollicipes]|uniref:uncharacterized protein LOC119106765 n=1 Tax=Pollicipes pollicipes TaxID=41117 RepID=UPI001884A6C5|nr:uncharacterized protein LOC119106765 [Pollicipes pollicipes]